jgi:hypothetical protein
MQVVGPAWDGYFASIRSAKAESKGEVDERRLFHPVLLAVFGGARPRVGVRPMDAGPRGTVLRRAPGSRSVDQSRVSRTMSSKPALKIRDPPFESA